MNKLFRNIYIHSKTVASIYCAVIPVVIAGCANTPFPGTSPFYEIPAGSKVELTQALTIPPHSARVYLQYGKVISENDKDRYQPNCWFLSWKVSDQPQLIQPDIFNITRTQKDDQVVQNNSTVKLASAEQYIGYDLNVAASKGKMNPLDGDAPLASEYTTQLFLQSDKQPDIRRLYCSHWDDTQTGEHLTLEQMQLALGKIASIIIK